MFRHYLVDRRADGSLWELGRGGMGVTYKAMDCNLHCPVAVKIIGPQCFGGERSRHRFIREARLAAQIRHPNVAAVYHLETEGDDVFYAMEFVDGVTADAWVKGRGPMRVELALDVVMQVTRALTAADRLRLVHRDIKPGNIMLLADPADRTRVIVKVIDFGLACSMGDEAGASHTTCAFVGTPQYASPEQIESLELDIRSDIYSLGCVLWYLLSGASPFVGSIPRVMAMQLTGEPPFESLPPSAEPVKPLLRAMLCKLPVGRPQSPVALHALISECRARLVQREQPQPALRRFSLGCEWRKWKSKLPGRVPVGIPVAVASMVIGGLMLWGWRTFAPEPHSAAAVTQGASIVTERSFETIPGVPASQTERGDGSVQKAIPWAMPPTESSLKELSQWEAPRLQLSRFQSEPEAFWAEEGEDEVAADFDLLRAGNVLLGMAGAELSGKTATPPAKPVTKSSPRNRKAASSERRNQSSNPLQRAGRTVQGFFNRLL